MSARDAFGKMPFRVSAIYALIAISISALIAATRAEWL
jgi:hypothetical protein